MPLSRTALGRKQFGCQAPLEGAPPWLMSGHWGPQLCLRPLHIFPSSARMGTFPHTRSTGYAPGFSVCVPVGHTIAYAKDQIIELPEAVRESVNFLIRISQQCGGADQ